MKAHCIYQVSKVFDQPANARKQYKKDIPSDIRANLASLEGKDNWHNILYLGFDWLIILGASITSMRMGMNPLIYILAVIIIASRQRALMNLVHEASHNKLFKNKALNDWMGKIFAAHPLGTSLSAYRSEHYIHHGFLWREEKDPKTQKYKRLGLLPPPSSMRKFLNLHIARLSLLIHVMRNILSFLSQKDEQRTETLTRLAFWIILLAGILITHLTFQFFFFWIIPYCTVYQVIHYLNELADHAGLQTEDAWMATRNWTSFFVVCWLLAPHSDDLYHLTHHLFPLIPHYRLAEAHRILMQVPEYTNAHHCNGFFWPRSSDAPSVVQDILRPRGHS